MFAAGFQALIAFTLALGAWVVVEVYLGRRTSRTKISPAAPWSEVLISVSTLVVLVAAVFATSIPGGQIHPLGPAVGLGIVLMMAGVAVRVIAADNLGSYYTLNVGIQPGQTVCNGGLYRWVRHPGYSGTLTALLGVGMAMGNWLSVLAILLILPAVGGRIALEERLLRRAFGDAYETYCRRTRWRLVPGVL